MELERLGPYRIVGKLGRGGMGTVYEGVHEETGVPAAIKLLSATLAQEEGFRNRFEVEIETLRKLNHPNIVRLYGFGEQAGLLYYAMELVDGSSLEEELRQGRRFDWRDVTQIGIDTCRALRHAHDRGVIHRDIKPGNLLRTAEGRVKLSDFGIARLFGNTRLTSAGNVLGTVEYMAPEQAEGRAVDSRADLYSLGALMYALLARRPVFRGKSIPEMLHKQRYENPEPIRTIVPDTPEELDRILTMLLEKDPDRRIPNADILARRLEAMLQALSIVPDTLVAEPDWFSSPPLKPAPTEVPPASSEEDLPDTEILHASEGDQAAALPSDSEDAIVAQTADTAPPLAPAPAEPAAPASPSGHFITVSEDELGDAEEETPRTSLFSWRTSWQIWALSAGLLFVGWSLNWFLQPPSAESLFQKISAKMLEDQADAHPMKMSDVVEAEALVNDFLNYYPGDPNAGRVRDFSKKLGLRKLELDFELRVRGRPSAENLTPIEQLYFEAMSYGQTDPTRAMAKLRALIDLCNRPEDQGEQTALCIALARRQLARLSKEVEKLSQQQCSMLQERLDAADAMRHTEPERAKATYRAVVELYAAKPWAAEPVRRARQALKK
jgi:eukaryotic-like serine/threonine-protein kinase